MRDANSHKYACFECRKCFKRAQFAATWKPHMTSEQTRGQMAELEAFEAARTYKCPDCGGATQYMGQDFRAPRKSDAKGWESAREFIASGKTYDRGARDRED